MSLVTVDQCGIWSILKWSEFVQYCTKNGFKNHVFGRAHKYGHFLGNCIKCIYIWECMVWQQIRDK